MITKLFNSNKSSISEPQRLEILYKKEILDFQARLSEASRKKNSETLTNLIP